MGNRNSEACEYVQTTRDILITVKTYYLDEQSSPEKSHYVFAYEIKIENQGPETVQLRNRHWQITDGHGHTQEVRGAGVVGEQPTLGPGERFEYTSGAPLTTDSGFMVGSYEMVTDGGEHFEVSIPAFSLDSPFANKRLN